MPECKNIKININKKDKELIEKSIKILKKFYEKEKHPVVTGILDSNDKMFFGLSQASPSGLNICAEPCALSNANLKSKTRKFKSIVSFRGKSDPPNILSPCGICRELLRFHYPNLNVIVVDESNEKHTVFKMKAKYLLPFPYYKTRSKEKDAFTNETWCCRGHNDKNFIPMKF